ncbi:hypothetical protein VCHENC02_2702B, partial [Vibrio harveyi]
WWLLQAAAKVLVSISRRLI